MAGAGQASAAPGPHTAAAMACRALRGERGDPPAPPRGSASHPGATRVHRQRGAAADRAFGPRPVYIVEAVVGAALGAMFVVAARRHPAR